MPNSMIEDIGNLWRKTDELWSGLGHTHWIKVRGR